MYLTDVKSVQKKLHRVNMNSEYFSKRFEAVFLHLHDKGPKLSIASTAKHIKKSEGFVKKWINQWKREKNVNDQPNVKPERATTSKQNERIVELFDKNPGITLDQGVERLSRRNIHVSRSTVSRRLQAKKRSVSSNHQKTIVDKKSR